MGRTRDSISFLKRRMVKLDDEKMVVPSTTAEKLAICFERTFGVAKVQKIPCDAGIQNEDVSPCLTAKEKFLPQRHGLTFVFGQGQT